MNSRAWPLPVALLLALLAFAPASTSAATSGPQAETAAGKRAAKSRCPAGTTPVVSGRGRKITVKRDRRGRLRCRKPKLGRPAAPTAKPLAQAAAVSDSLRTAARISPRSFDRLERAIGRRRAARLLGMALDAWEKPAGAARARASDSTTFAPSDGISGKADFTLKNSEGDTSGFEAAASADLTASRDGIAKLSSSAREKLPADVKSVKARLDVSFKDSVQKCPSSKGKQPGTLEGNGKIKITVERDGGQPVVVEYEATVKATYEAESGADGKWSSIDDLDLRTTFRAAATGESTQVYRGRRLGSGFGRQSILDSKNFGEALDRDAAHIDPDSGGVFGPKGGWNFKRGIGLSDLRTVDNVKSMLAAAIATNLGTLAAVEYLRKVTMKRAEEQKCGDYKVTLQVNGSGNFATHSTSGVLTTSVTATRPDPKAAKWSGSAPSAWANVAFVSKTDCPYHSPVSNGTFTVELELTGAGALKVTWSTDAGGGMATGSVDCPPDGENDPPPIPGQPGPALIGIAPFTFELPAGGGTQVLSGGFTDGGDGWTNDGTLTVERLG